MAVDARITQAGVLIPLEFVDGIVHQGIIEHPQGYQQLEIFHIQAGDLFEQSRLQLCDDILQTLLPVVRQIHEHRNAGGKFDELFLNLLPLGFVLLLGLGQLFFLLGGELIGALFFCLYDRLGFVDDGLNVLVETAEALDFPQGVHGGGVVHQPLQGLIVHIDQQGALPALCQQSGGSPGHGNVQHLARVDLPHGAAVVGDHWQEADKLRHLLLRTALVDVQTATVIRNLFQGPVQCEVEHIALLLDDLLSAALRRDLPGALHPECRLEIRLRAGQVPQHEDSRPGLHCHAGSQLAAGEGDRLGLQRVAHGLQHRLQRRRADACPSPSADVDRIIVIENILLLRQQIPHGKASRHIGQEPEGVL